MSTSAVFGCTGLTGHHILATLLGSDSVSTVHTISRRAPKTAPSPKLQAVVEPDTSQWPAKLAALAPAPTTVYSALGTTRAAAGGLANQWKIDHDLNVELVKAAKTRGDVKTFVFISSGGTRGLPFSASPYARMKNGVEDAIKEAGFDHAVILKPGFIKGEREVGRAGEGLMVGISSLVGKILGQKAMDSWSQDGEAIGRAAVRAAEMVAAGQAPSKYWVVDGLEIARMGRMGQAEKPQSDDAKQTAS
ncbi:hypothetical protein QBC39DRAFT_69988 [Podospora conica]|nr:hypothetical protein QBC39DRAFT_69988 [Schizothecium conicum]